MPTRGDVEARGIRTQMDVLGRANRMRLAFIAAALATLALLNVAGAPFARATDIDNFRADEFRGDCRVVETHTTNRWGEDVTVRRRICG